MDCWRFLPGVWLVQGGKSWFFPRLWNTGQSVGELWQRTSFFRCCISEDFDKGYWLGYCFFYFLWAQKFGIVFLLLLYIHSCWSYKSLQVTWMMWQWFMVLVQTVDRISLLSMACVCYCASYFPWLISFCHRAAVGRSITSSVCVCFTIFCVKSWPFWIISMSLVLPFYILIIDFWVVYYWAYTSYTSSCFLIGLCA